MAMRAVSTLLIKDISPDCFPYKPRFKYISLGKHAMISLETFKLPHVSL